MFRRKKRILENALQRLRLRPGQTSGQATPHSPGVGGGNHFSKALGAAFGNTLMTSVYALSLHRKVSTDLICVCTRPGDLNASMASGDFSNAPLKMPILGDEYLDFQKWDDFVRAFFHRDIQLAVGESLWPRDTLLKYYLQMCMLQENLREYQQISLLTGIYKPFLL